MFKTTSTGLRFLTESSKACLRYQLQQRCVSSCRSLLVDKPSELPKTNWAGNVHWQGKVLKPTSLEELQQIVEVSEQLRVLGTGHSFVEMANTSSKGAIVNLADIEREFVLNHETSEITIDGGTTYTELAEFLRGTGLALINTQSLPHVSVAGAICTATHGSSGVCPDTGRALLGSQSVHVTAVEYVGPNGDLITFKRGDADFDGAVISLGCLGPISRLTLQLVPEYDVLQAVYGKMDTPDAQHWPTEVLINNFDNLLKTCDSFSVMVDWPNDCGGMVVKRHFGKPGEAMTADSEWCGVPLTTELLPPLLGTNTPLQSTHQGTSSDVLFWFMEDGKVFGPQPPELQLEYFVPLDQHVEALQCVRTVASKWKKLMADGQNLLLYSELRVVKGDSLWLSQNTTEDGGDTLALAFGMNISDPKLAMKCAHEMETALARFKVRPHWAKLHAMLPAHVTALYGDDVARFRSLRLEHDRHGKFENEWSTSYAL
eukprot:m.16672 g.16672  ORF g.16672 m.16672 type:complete len:487 (+) comp11155_c0_seq1:176-1636(+)